MSRESGGLTELFGGLIALFSVPGLGLVLLIAAGVLILIMLGLFVWVYITLQSMHLITAIVFGVISLFMFYMGTRSHVITEETLKRFPWLPLLIPGAFLFGYLADITQSIRLQVAPLATASAQQGSVNAIVVFLMAIGILYVVSEHVDGGNKKRRRR